MATRVDATGFSGSNKTSGQATLALVGSSVNVAAGDDILIGTTHDLSTVSGVTKTGTATIGAASIEKSIVGSGGVASIVRVPITGAGTITGLTITFAAAPTAKLGDGLIFRGVGVLRGTDSLAQSSTSMFCCLLETGADTGVLPVAGDFIFAVGGFEGPVGDAMGTINRSAAGSTGPINVPTAGPGLLATSGGGATSNLEQRTAYTLSQSVDVTADGSQNGWAASQINSRNNHGCTVWYAPAATGQSVTLTPATEADTAQALSITHPIHVDLAPATEIDTPVALVVQKKVPILPATTVNSAQLLDVDKSVILAPGTTVNSAQPLTALKNVPIAPAAEIDSAVAVTFTQGGAAPQFITIVPATETDSSQPFSTTKSAALAPATSVESAQGLSTAKSASITPATEADSAQSVTVRKSVAVTFASEVDAAQPLTPAHAFTLIPSVEIDTAQPFTITKRSSTLPAIEADAAQPLTLRKNISIAPSIEADSALSLSFVKPIFVTLTPSVENDTAPGVSIVKSVLVTPAASLDVAVGLSFGIVGGPNFISLTAAVESDQSVPLTILKAVPLFPAVEDDTASGLDWTLVPGAFEIVYDVEHPLWWPCPNCSERQIVIEAQARPPGLTPANVGLTYRVYPKVVNTKCLNCGFKMQQRVEL